MKLSINPYFGLKRVLTIGFFVIGLLGCANQVTTVPTENWQVEIAPDVWVSMPEPSDLGYTLDASQLISAKWQGQTNQLPVQLQVNEDKLVLVGFSSWGTRILSLEYQDDKVDSQILAGIDSQEIMPEKILFNLMLTLWPVESWEQPLSNIGWTLVDTPKHRQLLNVNGEAVIDIQYSAMPHLEGEILFSDNKLGYFISIKTLTYEQ